MRSMLPNHFCKRPAWLLFLLSIIWIFAGNASAASVLVLSTGSEAIDKKIAMILESNDNVVTIGPPYFKFTGGGLEGQNVVFLVSNLWEVGDMPAPGQEALVNFVANG